MDERKLARSRARKGNESKRRGGGSQSSPNAANRLEGETCKRGQHIDDGAVVCDFLQIITSDHFNDP